jgi:HSP20 family protein
MANISIRRGGNGGEAKVAKREQSSPFEMMRQMLRWDPFAEMFPAWGPGEGFAPDFDVKETKDAIVFKADLPGVEIKDLDIKLMNNRLTISGKKEEEKEEKTDTFYRRERSSGSFTRSFTLPEGVDADRIEAELKSGVLCLTLPKKPEAQPKQVSVKGS